MSAPPAVASAPKADEAKDFYALVLQLTNADQVPPSYPLPCT